MAKPGHIVAAARFAASQSGIAGGGRRGGGCWCCCRSAVTLANAAGAGWQMAAALLLRPLVGALLVNTLLLIACTATLCAVIGTAAAWAVERTDLPGNRFWGVLAVVPLAIPPFITSYAWVSLDPGLENFTGALLVVTVSYYPLVYLPVAAALREMDPALEETARSLGQHGVGSVFLRVVLPQLRPALLGGMLLVALDVLVEFGAFALLRFRTFTTAIYSAYRAGFSGAEPALLAVVLLVLCIACLAAEYLVRGKAQYGRLARGTRRQAASYSSWPLESAAADRFRPDGAAHHRRAAWHDRLLAHPGPSYAATSTWPIPSPGCCRPAGLPCALACWARR